MLLSYLSGLHIHHPSFCVIRPGFPYEFHVASRDQIYGACGRSFHRESGGKIPPRIIWRSTKAIANSVKYLLPSNQGPNSLSTEG